jgi:hypothetical protein
MATIKNTSTKNAGEDVGEREGTSYTLLPGI